MIASRILQYSIWPAHYAWNGAPYTIAMVRNKLLQSNKTAIKQFKYTDHSIWLTMSYLLLFCYIYFMCAVCMGMCVTHCRGPFKSFRCVYVLFTHILWWLVVIHTLSARNMGHAQLWSSSRRWGFCRCGSWWLAGWWWSNGVFIVAEHCGPLWPRRLLLQWNIMVAWRKFVLMCYRCAVVAHLESWCDAGCWYI